MKAMHVFSTGRQCDRLLSSSLNLCDLLLKGAATTNLLTGF